MPSGDDGWLSDRDIAEIANDIFLAKRLGNDDYPRRAARVVSDQFTLRAPSRGARQPLTIPPPIDDSVTSLFCALAQQCFLNEYVYAQE